MSNKKHLTAIQWLQYKIGEMGITHYFNLDQLIKQAKELEKQQIIDAYNQCEEDDRLFGNVAYEYQNSKMDEYEYLEKQSLICQNGEQYYKENYEQ